jgi:hypothetical protein
LLESRKAESEKENQETREDGSPQGQHGGRGHIELKMIPDSKTGKTYEPYRYLRYWGMTKKGAMGLRECVFREEIESSLSDRALCRKNPLS